jgi:Uma2 family endonuclease
MREIDDEQSLSFGRSSGYIDVMQNVAFRSDRDKDHIRIMEGVAWSDYLRIMRERGDHSAPRIAYLEGRLEIMSPSQPHEGIKSRIGGLVETWCLEREIEFDAFGGWTLKDKRVARAIEPDECYVFGPPRGATRPDLAIEVIWTSGGLDKLEIYRKLRVREVWVWRQDELTAQVLRDLAYEPVSESQVLPGIDLRQLAGFLDQPTMSAAIRAYRELLRKA